MSGLVTTIPTGVTTFSVTNIDDLVILTLLFSQVNATFRRRHILVGQYLGFSALVITSLRGFFAGLVVPRPWIGLLGLIPIAIGLDYLLNQEGDLPAEVAAETGQSDHETTTSFISPQAYSVAAITFANGGDNIGVYAPLFASSTLESLLVILGVFFLLIGVWCYTAYQLIRQRAIANVLTRYGNTLVPFVLIGLGILIVVENGTLASRTMTLLTLVAGYLCLTTLDKNNG